MSSPDAGTYIIRPTSAPDNQVVMVGPVPATYPPFDVPARVGRFTDRWILKNADNNTFTVFTGRGQPNDYKWVIGSNDVDLYVSAVSPPENFRFESAASGNDLYVIGRFGQDAVLTYGGDDVPQLTFKPADGSDAQRFELVRIDRLD